MEIWAYRFRVRHCGIMDEVRTGCPAQQSHRILAKVKRERDEERART
jgi:hypothetical protein